MHVTVAHLGNPLGPLGVTSSQVLPPSGLTWTRPSSLPAHSSPCCTGDSATAKMVPYTSTPVLSPVIGPPDHFCFDLSLRVRSSLTGFQLRPSSLVTNSLLLAWYTVRGSCFETTIGAVHWKR